MSRKKVTASDPMRRMALLWGSQSEAGRSGLTVRAIVAAAMDIADAEGVTALSMRTVAQRLTVGAMSLYTHVPGKSELFDLMLDTAYSQIYATVDEPSQQPGDWRDALRFIAQRNWAIYRKHPWMLEIGGGRPVLGPHEALKYEAELRPLDQIGLSDVEMDATLTLVLTHVAACARAQIALEQTRHTSGLNDDEWWITHGPLLDKFIDADRFPVATRIGTAAGLAYGGAAGPEHALTFGLERILAGVAELIRTR